MASSRARRVGSSRSGDAIAGGTRVGPDEALRYAEGEEITSNTMLTTRYNTVHAHKYPLGESNPCCRTENPES